MRSSGIFATWMILLPVFKSESEPNVWYCNYLTDYCYIINDQLTDLDQAQSYCRKFNSSLISITSKVENEDIANICGCQSCWIGLVERTEGDWYWLDGSNSTYRNWFEDEPNNYDGVNEDVTVMNIVIGQMFLVSRSWFDVTRDLDEAAAICKLRRITVNAMGSVSRRLPLEEEKCEDPNAMWRWIPSVLFMLFICCICSSCYCCFRSRARSRNRDAHTEVLRKQEAFLRTQHLQQLSVPQNQIPQQQFCYAPINQLSPVPSNYQVAPVHQYSTQAVDMNQRNTYTAAQPVNSGSQVYGAVTPEGVPQQSNPPQYSTTRPVEHYAVEGVTTGESAPPPPAYNHQV